MSHVNAHSATVITHAKVHAQPLSPNSNNQSPSWKPRQPPTALYVYTSIRDIEADT